MILELNLLAFLFAALLLVVLIYLRAPVEGLRARLDSCEEAGKENTPAGVSIYLITALLLMEDPKFFNHSGFDWPSVLRQIRNRKQVGRLHGGSTVSQQLVKCVFTDSRRTFARKVKEANYTYKLERHFSKDEILALYLKLVPWGPKAVGAIEAAKLFFAKSHAQLSIGEAVLLAVHVRAPRVLAVRVRTGEMSRKYTNRNQQKIMDVLSFAQRCQPQHDFPENVLTYGMVKEQLRLEATAGQRCIQSTRSFCVLERRALDYGVQLEHALAEAPLHCENYLSEHGRR